MPPRGLRLANKHLHERMKLAHLREMLSIYSIEEQYSILENKIKEILNQPDDFKYCVESGLINENDIFEYLLYSKKLSEVNSQFQYYFMNNRSFIYADSEYLYVYLFNCYEFLLENGLDCNRISNIYFPIVKQNLTICLNILRDKYLMDVPKQLKQKI